MNIILDREVFFESLEAIFPSINYKTNNSFKVIIQKNQGLNLIGNNPEVSCKALIEQFEIQSEGEFCLPFFPIFQLMNQLTENYIEINFLKDKCLIKTDTGDFSFFFQESSEFKFPKLPKVDFEILRKDLYRIYNEVEFCCAKEPSRYSMNGIFFEQKGNECLTAGTDGRRLALSRCVINNFQSDEKTFLLPNRILGLMLKNSFTDDDQKIKVGEGDSFVVFFNKQTTVFIQKINGNFPDFKSIIPKNSRTIASGEMQKFKSSIKQLLLFCENDYPIVNILIKGSILELKAESNQVGKCDLKLETNIQGPGGDISLNPKFLLDGLNHSFGETFIFSMNDLNSPCTLNLGESGVYIMMPVTKI